MPCKKISNLDDYLEKRKNKQLEEAVEVFELYYKHYGKIPDKTIFREFFFLFENEPIENLNEVFTKVLYLADSYDKSCDKYKTKNSLFNNYDEFVSYCMQKIDKDK